MRVSLRTITVSDRTRRALSHYLDRAGRASRDEVRDYCLQLVQDTLDGITSEYEERQRHRHERAEAVREKRRRRQGVGDSPQP